VRVLETQGEHAAAAYVLINKYRNSIKISKTSSPKIDEHAALRPLSVEKLHSARSPMSMFPAMKQTKTIPRLQRHHLLDLPGP